MLKKRLKQLSKDSLIYGVGNLFGKSINFFLIPIYTRIFSPAEYGSIETLLMINNFLGALIVLGMDSAQSYFFFDQKDRGISAQSAVVSAIFQWRILWGIILILLASFCAPLLNHHFFQGELKLYYFLIAFSSALFIQMMNQCMGLYRLLFKATRYITLTLLHTVLTGVLILIIVHFLHFRLLGYFIGYAITAAFIAIIGWILNRKYLTTHFNRREWWPKLLKIGVPLMPAGIAMYLLNSTDRWFIIYHFGQEYMGIYSVALKFAMFLYLAVYTFRRAWWPVAMDALQSNEGTQLFRLIARLYFGLGIMLIVLLTLFSPLIMKFLAAPEYHSAYPFIGILSWSAILYGFYMIIVVGIWKREKTYLIPVCIGSAAVMNVLLNIWLVPLYKGYGASLSTAISFVVWNTIIYFISERLWPIRYPIHILSLQFIIGAISCVFILFAFQNQFALYWIIIVALFSSLILTFSSIDRKHIPKIMNFFKGHLQK